MPRRPALWGPVLLLAACATVNPQISQLDRFKQQAAVHDWPIIVGASVSCAAESAGCAQLHQIKGDACMTLASEAAAADQAPRYDCAIAQYGAAIQAQAAHPDAAVDPVRLRTADLEALQRRRDRSRSRQEATPFNDRLVSAAGSTIQAFPGQAAGYYYLAGGLLSQGLAEPAPQSCRILDQASAALDGAASHQGAVPEAIAQRRRDVANARAGGCKG
jgi:hypothetical protein